MSVSWVNAFMLAMAASVAATPVPRSSSMVVPRNTTDLVGDEYMNVLEWAWGVDGYNKVWEEAWWGDAGSSVNEANWNIITGLHVNNEWQEYTTSNQNIQISGGGTLQIVPRKDTSTGQWTSGRIESKYTFTPEDGRRTLAEARIRFGTNAQANKQGIWPAFWFLGDSIRNGVAWPGCGEIDAMERLNGLWEAHGTVHCDTTSDGACQEPTGITSVVGLANDDWHTWRIVWDRTPGNWWDETITWYLDGNQFHQVSGGYLANEAAWNAIAASPVFFILNVAVGGNWPGPPNDSTLDGYGAMMEVSYVSQHVSI